MATETAKRSAKARPATVTRREVAAVMGVAMLRVTKWEQAGMPVWRRGRRGKPSLYRLDDVRAWLKHRDAAASQTPTAAGQVDLVAERARKERAQAVLAEQLAATRARDLLPRHEVEKAWLAEVTAVRSRLLAWSTTLTDQVHRASTLEGLPGVERAIDKAVRELLTELSGDEPAARVETPAPEVTA